MIARPIQILQVLRALAWKLPRETSSHGPPTIARGAPLRAIRRRAPATEVILHESVTSSRKSTVAVLRRQNYGVHFIVGRDGTITQHVHPRTHYTVHAGGSHNRSSIAVEIVNPYYGSRASDDDVVIPAVWAHKGEYILPCRAQVEAVWRLLSWLDVEYDDCEALRFPCVDESTFRWGRDGRHTLAGTTAHHRHAHADALFAEHYCVVRSRGYAPDEAWLLTVTAAQAGDRKTNLPPHQEL